MCFIVLPKPPVQRLIVAALHVQNLLDNGTLTNAWGDGKPDDINTAVAAFDRLQEATTALGNEEKAASPFLRYRREIMANTPAGAYLQRLVLSLYSGHTVPLRHMIERFGEHEIRIALECLTSFAANGDRDSQFMSLGLELAQSDDDSAIEVAA